MLMVFVRVAWTAVLFWCCCCVIWCTSVGNDVGVKTILEVLYGGD